MTPWLMTIGSVLFALLIFLPLFRRLPPRIVKDDYKPCSGEWHESFLNGCDQGLLRVPQQPVNTYSNLAYLAVGVFAASTFATPASSVFVATMIYLCVGSMLYHATSTRWAGMMDVTAIYAVFSALAVYAVAVVVGVPRGPIPLIMFVAGGAAAYFLAPRYKRDMRTKIAIFLGTAYLFLLIRLVPDWDWGPGGRLIASLVAFAIAFGIWNLDKAKKFPLKGWGHGFWHVLSALASYFVFEAIHLIA